MRAQVVAVATLVMLLGGARGGTAQGEPFFDALGELRASLAGTFGDEGQSLEDQIADLSARLAAWDARIRDREVAFRTELARAAPAEAAEIHASLGSLYLARARLPDALEEFEAASRIAPQPAKYELFRGMLLEAMGNAPEAAVAFRNAARLDPDNPVAAYLALQGPGADEDRTRFRDTLLRAEQRALSGLARAAPDAFLPVRAFGDPGAPLPLFPPARYAGAFARHLDGAYERGLEELRSTAAVDPLAADPAMELAPMSEASAALRQGDVAGAVTMLEAIVRRLPGSSEAHRMLATAYDLSGNLDRSVEHLEAAIRLREDNERAWLALARVRRVTADDPDIVRTLERAVAAVPDSGSLHWQLAGLARLRDDGGAALEHYTEAARLPAIDGDGEVQRWVAELAYLLQDVDRAIDAAQRRIRLTPEQPAAHRALADLYGKQGRHEAAFDELSIALWLAPDDPITLSALGLNHLARGRAADALAVLERAVLLAPGFRQARYALGQALVRVGRREEGRQHLAEFQRLHAEWMAASREAFTLSRLKRRAALEATEGQHELAAKTWIEVIALEPDDARNHLALAEALLAAELPEAGLQALVNAAALDGVAEVHLRIANVLTQLGRDSEAALAWETYQRLRLSDLAQVR